MGLYWKLPAIHMRSVRVVGWIFIVRVKAAQFAPRSGRESLDAHGSRCERFVGGNANRSLTSAFTE